MDEIRVKGLKVFAYHGVRADEEKNGQEFLVDITAFLSTKDAGKSDDLEKTVNYGELSFFVYTVFKEKRFRLIEAAAEYLADKCLKQFEHLNEVEVTVHKPSAPITVPFEDVSVTIRRKWHTAYIAVGSNLGDSEHIIREGVEYLTKADDIVLYKSSRLISTKPYGVTDQPDFLNGMIVVRTLLEPHELLDRLHKVESYEKRERTMRWGPRTLDLDIIYYDDLVMGDDELIIPHEDMQNRDFVLKPLLEIAPGKRHPITGDTPEMMLKKLHA